jgi:hypothetical protein
MKPETLAAINDTHITEGKCPNYKHTQKQTWKNANIHLHTNLEHKRGNETTKGFGNRFCFRLQVKVCFMCVFLAGSLFFVDILVVLLSVICVFLSFIATCGF